MTDPAPPLDASTRAKTLRPSQTGFLAVMVLAVVAMFVFVIRPYIEVKPTVSGKEAPEFDLELLSGGGAGDRVRLSNLRGKKVVLEFWASWCLPCREQSEVLAKLAPTLGPDVVVLGVATSDSREEVEKFLKEKPGPYSNAFDEDGVVGQAFEIKELPTLLVLDKRGTVRSASTRSPEAREIRSMVEAAE